jgi:hypothetical protein
VAHFALRLARRLLAPRCATLFRARVDRRTGRLAAAGALAGLLALGGGLTVAASAQADVPTLLVRVGYKVVPAAQTAAVAAAVDASNGFQRIPGLPDRLNPGIIDPAKAAALLAALQRMGAPALAPIGGKGTVSECTRDADWRHRTDHAGELRPTVPA